VMSKDWPTISPNEDIWRAVNLMADRSFKLLPVVQDGKLEGLLHLDAITRNSPALATMAFSKSIQSHAHNSGLYKQKATVSGR